MFWTECAREKGFQTAVLGYRSVLRLRKKIDLFKNLIANTRLTLHTYVKTILALGSRQGFAETSVSVEEGYSRAGSDRYACCWMTQPAQPMVQSCTATKHTCHIYIYIYMLDPPYKTHHGHVRQILHSDICKRNIIRSPLRSSCFFRVA